MPVGGFVTPVPQSKSRSGRNQRKARGELANGLSAQPSDYPNTASFAKQMPDCAARKHRFGKSGFNTAPAKSGFHGHD